MKGLTTLAAWKALEQHAEEVRTTSLSALFLEDTERFSKLSLRESDLLLDYSKNPITERTITLLVQLADALDLRQGIHDLFSGQCVNTTQQLPALHTALRDPRTSGVIVDGQNILSLIHAALDQMDRFCEKVRTNEWFGATGQAITDIVHLGIGGSELGSLMAVESLQAYRNSSIRLHFVSHIDQPAFYALLQKLNAETTLFIVTSKSFNTLETLTNAKTGFRWLKKNIPHKLHTLIFKQHFLGITANVDQAEQFGILSENILPLWSWVGGRFSLCSCVGLPLALSIGMENFREFLRGAYTMDQHFYQKPWSQNMPVLLGLLAIWQRNFFHTEAHVILPYDRELRYFPDYLQQLEMESNGKSMRMDHKKVDYATCPLIFGASGVQGQHAFFQLLHQGTSRFSADFIISLYDTQKSPNSTHPQLFASTLSQSKALMEGYTSDLPYKTLPGNHASNTLAFKQLTPFTLGLLVALYEHKVFVQSVIWHIDPFDQWGVEYGKQLRQSIYQDLVGTTAACPPHDQPRIPLDSSTRNLAQLYQKINGIHDQRSQHTST